MRRRLVSFERITDGRAEQVIITEARLRVLSCASVVKLSVVSVQVEEKSCHSMSPLM